MRLSIKRRDQIEDLAAQVRGQTGFAENHDILTLVSTLGGDVEQIESHEMFPASVKKRNDSFVIGSKKTDKLNFRFNVAHEVGHLFLHMGYLINKDRWNEINEYIDAPYYRFGYSLEEIEADEFAYCFLMPRESFISEYTASGKYSGLDKLAKKFKVSKEIAQNRVRMLAL